MSKKPMQIIAVVALLIATLFIVGIRVAHPQLGLQSSLGSAKTTLVIYKSVNVVAKDSKVVVKTNDGQTGTGIARVVTNEHIDVNLNTKFERIPSKDIKGKLILVIPFIGVILGVIGL
jgi:glutathione synthase/RimK-type ligase-like ATP-grasp enzyme